MKSKKLNWFRGLSVVGLLSVTSVGLAADLKNESRAGLLVTTGNSKAQTYDLAQLNSYHWGSNALSGAAGFLRSTSRGLESAKRWNLGIRFERHIGERWGFFLGQKIEGDRYAGFYQRYSTDVGGLAQALKDESNLLQFELGYRFQHENQVAGLSKNTSFSRAYGQYTRQWNPSVSSRLWAEYLQSFQASKDYFLNTEVSLRAALTSVFSFQLAYLLRYRNDLPEKVLYKTDTTTTASILAQF